MNPKQIVEKWVALFNAGEAAGMAELYADDAINHQVMQEPVVGRAALLAMFEADFPVPTWFAKSRRSTRPAMWRYWNGAIP